MTEKKRKFNFLGSIYFVTDKGHVENASHRRMKPFDNGNGYLVVSFSSQGKRKNFYVHRLVSILYIPNTHNLPEVNHIDGDKYNNCVSNLEWLSRKQNVEHAIKTGLTRLGSKAWNANLSAAQAKLVLQAYWAGIPAKDIMEAFKISRHTVNDIARKRIYKRDLEETK